jgi:hypothetical protein
MKAYAVGVILADLSEKPRRFIKESRLWCLFAKLEDAEKCVLENHGDIFEYYYNMAVIEEVSVIDPNNVDKTNSRAYIPKQWWYKITYCSEGNYTIDKVSQPAIFQNIVNIWIG